MDDPRRKKPVLRALGKDGGTPGAAAPGKGLRSEQASRDGRADGRSATDR